VGETEGRRGVELTFPTSSFLPPFAPFLSHPRCLYPPSPCLSSLPLTDLTLRSSSLFPSSPAGLSTPSEVLLPARDVLAKTLKPLPRADVDQLVDAVARGLCPVPTRLGALKEEGQGLSSEASGSGGVGREQETFDLLSFGDAEIDELLGGGIRKSMITEIVGER